MSNLFDIVYFEFKKIMDSEHSEEIKIRMMSAFCRKEFNKRLKDIAKEIKEQNAKKWIFILQKRVGKQKLK